MRTLLFLLILIVGVQANAQTATPPRLLYPTDSGKVELAPRIHAMHGKLYAAWIEEVKSGNGDIMFTTSTNGGAEFAKPIRVTNTGGINATLQRGPEFVVDTGGVIHMVWMETRSMNQPDIFYTKSTDNGTTWSEPRDISRHMAAQDFPSIACDSIGNVYVCWIDSREVKDGTSDNDHVYFARSDDGGKTFNDPIRADRNPGDVGGSCECCRTAMQCMPDGSIYIAYRSNMNNVRDIFVVESPDRGRLWMDAVKMHKEDWHLMSCPATGPMTTLDKNNVLHVVFRAPYNGKPALLYSALPHPQSIAMQESPIGLSSASNFGSVAHTSKGITFVAFQTGADAQVASTSDGGTTWLLFNGAIPTEGRKQFVALTVDANDEVHMLWQDDARDGNDIYYQMITQDYEGSRPSLMSVTSEIRNDSVTFKWSATGEPFTWFEVAQGTTTAYTWRDTWAMPLEKFNSASVTLTPVNIVGKGETRTLNLASVRSREDALNGLIVMANGEIKLPVASDNEQWVVHDLNGRDVSRCVSTASRLTVPTVPAGIYYVSNGTLAYKLVILPR